MITGKKEIGKAVMAVAQYANDCFENENYLEMNEAFKLAINMAHMYEIREKTLVTSFYGNYLSEAVDRLEYKIAIGNEAKNILKELRGE